jgi:hypothetical protein
VTTHLLETSETNEDTSKTSLKDKTCAYIAIIKLEIILLHHTQYCKQSVQENQGDDAIKGKIIPVLH